MTSGRAVLTVNAGSSSLKFALFDAAPEPPRLLGGGQIEGIPGKPHMVLKDADGVILSERHWPSGPAWRHQDFLDSLFAWTDSVLQGDRLVAAGHRVVHGGAEFAAPVLVDAAILGRLQDLCPLAPLHQPHNLAAITAIAAARPDLPQVACFDTAFHHSHPDVASRLALPEEWRRRGLRRYGFHGLSYDYIARRLGRDHPRLAAGKVVVAHLGNGASLCAMENGRSRDSTMGFTALDGLIMGTRCGNLDPGVALYLLQQGGLSPAQLEDLLYHRSGLLGLSGESADMRVLQASRSPAAAAAIDSFVYRVCREIGAMAAALDGVDGLVFTAGIGENAPAIRALICARLGWLGARLDPARNQAGEIRIAADDSALELLVVPTDEEAMIAHHTVSFVTN